MTNFSNVKTNSANLDLVFIVEPEIYLITDDLLDLSTITSPTVLRGLDPSKYVRDINPIAP